MKFILIFLLFYFSIHSQNADFRGVKNLNKNEYPVWDKTMKGVSFTVYPFMGASVGTLLIDGYCKKDPVMIRNGYKTAIALGVNILFTEGAKYSFKRKRPFEEYPNDIVMRMKATGYSFPSGHTSSAFCTATCLTLSTKKWFVAVPAYSYAGLIAYSRMRLGVHYPSDVLGGVLVGIGSGLLTWQIDKWVNKK